MTTFVTASKARKGFFKFFDLAEKPGYRVAVTHEGIPKLMLMSFDEYEELMETLDIMSDPKLQRSIRAGMQDMKKGRVKTLEQVKAELRS